MSRKTDRALRKAAKKATTAPTVEKVDAAEELGEEEDIPEAVAIQEEEEDEVDEEEQEDDDEEEEEENDEEEDEEEELDEEELEELQAAKAKALKPKINDEAAMIRITEGFKLKDLPWIETMTVTSSKPIEVDVKDDMARELAFYQQALEAAQIGRDLIKKAGAAFTRPEDYFAEMLKSDEHMAKVRQRLLDESAQVKASEEAKRQRQLKKFGKKVQVEKQLERQKQKTEMLDKIKLLKRKRKDGEDLTTTDDFDIALENADTSTKKRAKTDKKTPTKGKKRQFKDQKYGFGGKKRYAKSNTAESSDAIGGYNKMRKSAFGSKGGKKGKR